MKENPIEETNKKNPTSTTNPEKIKNEINPGATRTETLDDDDEQYEDIDHDDVTYIEE